MKPSTLILQVHIEQQVHVPYKAAKHDDCASQACTSAFVNTASFWQICNNIGLKNY